MDDAAAAPMPLDAAPSRSHVVLIPSYNTGAQRLLRTVREALAQWRPVWVVIDGSDDGSGEAIENEVAALDRATAASPAKPAGTERPAEPRADTGLRVLRLPRNCGKGAAVLHGLLAARVEGYTHALTMDADGQHPAALIPTFMRASRERAGAMILGRPVFDADAPQLRVQGRRISNAWTRLETWGAGIADSLYGFRVYPIEPLVATMQRQRWMRRFDFDTEAVVRLAWHGVKPINLDAPVVYLRPEDGGVSHFNYVRDNLLLSWMHARLLAGFIARWPRLMWQRLKRQGSFTP